MRERVLVGLLALALTGGCKTGVEQAKADIAAENAPVAAQSKDALATMREGLTQELRRNSPWKDVLWDAAIVGHPIKGIWLVGDALYVETRDHYVYSLDAASGFTRWAYHVGARLQSRPAPAVGILDQIAAQKEQINSITAKVEKARAEKNREDQAKAENELRDAKGRLTVVEDGDLIYLMAEDKVHCLDRLGGHHYWTMALEFSPSSPLFATTQHLLVGSFQLARLHAIDVRTRREAWFARLAEVCNTMPVHVDPSTYVTSNDGSVYALANDGQPGWRYKTEKAIVADPVVWESTLFVGSTDYALYALDRNTGVVRWKVETTAPITRTPVVAGKNVYVRSDDNMFLSIGVDGKKRWGVPNGERFLGRTQHWTWVLMPDWEIVGINEATGNIESRYQATNFPVVVANPDTPRMYFATHDGLIFCATESKVNF